MSFVNSILMRAFGRPQGVLGRLGGIIMARMNQRMAQRAIELLEVETSDTVLEIGFGPGVGVQILAGVVSTGRVAGIDPSEEMVEQARARTATGTGTVELRRGSVERLPYEDATFDKAMAINSMQVWPDAAAGLQETRRVLRPEGRLVLGFTRHSGQTKDGLTALLAAAGFADARVVDVDGAFCVVTTNPGGSGQAASNNQTQPAGG